MFTVYTTEIEPLSKYKHKHKHKKRNNLFCLFNVINVSRFPCDWRTVKQWSPQVTMTECFSTKLVLNHHVLLVDRLSITANRSPSFPVLQWNSSLLEQGVFLALHVNSWCVTISCIICGSYCKTSQHRCTMGPGLLLTVRWIFFIASVWRNLCLNPGRPRIFSRTQNVQIGVGFSHLFR